MSEEQLLASLEWKKLLGNTRYSIRSVSAPYKHILSHQKIYARFLELNCEQPLYKTLSQDLLIIKECDIEKYAVPRLIENYLEKRK